MKLVESIPVKQIFLLKDLRRTKYNSLTRNRKTENSTRAHRLTLSTLRLFP